jgi:hypothetical protein
MLVRKNRIQKVLELLIALVVILPGWCAAELNPLLPRPQTIQLWKRRAFTAGAEHSFCLAPGHEDRLAAGELAKALSPRAEVAIPIREEGRCEHGIRLERTGGIEALPVPGEQPGPLQPPVMNDQQFNDAMKEMDSEMVKSTAYAYYRSVVWMLRCPANVAIS